MFNNITLQIEGDFMVSNDRKAKYLAFTLAEVLITLGIIGVVAAMTIPTLMSAYREKVIVNQLKKVHAVLNQAFKLAVAENDNPKSPVRISLVGYRVANTIEDMFEAIGFNDPDFESEYSTVGGFATEILDRFPKVGDTFTYHNLEFKIIAAQSHRVEQLSVTVRPQEEEDYDNRESES